MQLDFHNKAGLLLTDTRLKNYIAFHGMKWNNEAPEKYVPW